MKPTGNDDGDIPDEPQDELVAQIVPLRRRQDEAEHRDQPHDESLAANDADDWSVFDPPENLQPAERRDQPHGVSSDHDLPAEDLKRPWTSMPRGRNRLLAFAGVTLTVIAIAALAVLTLKGHAGASPSPAPLKPSAVLPANSAVQRAPQAPPPSPPRRSTSAQPGHRKTKHRTSQRSRTLRHPALASRTTSQEISPGPSSGESAAVPMPSEPSSPAAF